MRRPPRFGAVIFSSIFFVSGPAPALASILTTTVRGQVLAVYGGLAGPRPGDRVRLARHRRVAAGQGLLPQPTPCWHHLRREKALIETFQQTQWFMHFEGHSHSFTCWCQNTVWATFGPRLSA